MRSIIMEHQSELNLELEKETLYNLIFYGGQDINYGMVKNFRSMSLINIVSTQ